MLIKGLYGFYRFQGGGLKWGGWWWVVGTKALLANFSIKGKTLLEISSLVPRRLLGPLVASQMFLPRSMIGLSKRWCDWPIGLPRISLITWLFLLPSLHDFCMNFHEDPEGMDGRKKHETSARCRASRSVKQSKKLVIILGMGSANETMSQCNVVSRWPNL